MKGMPADSKDLPAESEISVSTDLDYVLPAYSYRK